VKEVKYIEGTTPDGKERRLGKSSPWQLMLFGNFVPGTDHRFSNTLELYDAIPKHVRSSNRISSQRVDGKYLPILERNFRYRDRTTGETHHYAVELRPARIKIPALDDDGVPCLVEREFYPAAREELVEEALRKIATDTLSGVYLDDQAGVQFTLSQLRRELAARRHGFTLDEIKQALQICHSTSVKVTSTDGEGISSGTIFPVLLMSSREKWLKEPGDARCYVQFHPLITQSINRLTFRQFDYDTHMLCRNQLARWLHKRLSHNYINANWDNAYTIKATTIIADSCLINNERLRDRISAIDGALQELLDEDVISKFDKELIHVGRKLTDAKFHVHPSLNFIDNMKLANKRLRDQRDQGVDNGDLQIA